MPAAHLRIVELCAPGAAGGLESVVQQVSAGLAQRGHHVTVIAAVEPDQDIDAFFAPLTRAGVHPIRLELPGRAYLRERRELGRLLDRLHPDVLHTHGYRSDVLHGGPARRRGIATVTTLHGFSVQGGVSRLGQWLQLHHLRHFDAVIAVARPIVSILAARGIPQSRVHHVPNAWRMPEGPAERTEARRMLGLTPGNEPVIGWVGRLEAVKGADIFLRALAELADRSWTACIVGHGSEGDALAQLARELGLLERVCFAGLVAEAPRCFSAFDLLVSSSRSEGTPMVLLEAMGAGVPVVATAVGGVPDLMGGGDAGWMVPPESPTALACAIREALADAPRAGLRAHRAQQRVAAEFSWDAWMSRHEEVYHKAIAVRRGS